MTLTTNATDDERRVPLFNQVSNVMTDRCATNKLVEDLKSQGRERDSQPFQVRHAPAGRTCESVR